MRSKGSIRLFWWSEIYLQHRDQENYGDLLGKYLVERISRKKVEWTHPKKFSIQNLWSPIYVTIGSILAQVTSSCVVWGSGIIDRTHPVKAAKFLAVRGPRTRARLLELGYEVPEVYGDPALLLPMFYKPTVAKKYRLGIIPHYTDHKEANALFANDDTIKVIDLMTNDIEGTTDQILACETMISSSLHGVIVAHAYGIPCVQVVFSEKIFGDGVKYQDYLESVNLQSYTPILIADKQQIEALIAHVNSHSNRLPDTSVLQEVQKRLMDSCPFNQQSE